MPKSEKIIKTGRNIGKHFCPSNIQIWILHRCGLPDFFCISYTNAVVTCIGLHGITVRRCDCEELVKVQHSMSGSTNLMLKTSLARLQSAFLTEQKQNLDQATGRLVPVGL